jgi:hypothetical protein
VTEEEACSFSIYLWFVLLMCPDMSLQTAYRHRLCECTLEVAPSFPAAVQRQRWKTSGGTLEEEDDETDGQQASDEEQAQP